MSDTQRATVIEQKTIGEGLLHLRLSLEKAWDSRPPQFLRLSLPDSRDPYLPRPFVIFSARGSEIEILYQLRGRFTQALASLPHGARLTAHGPLGQPFLLPEGKRALLVGGGVGAAVLHPYLETRPSNRDRFLLGASRRETAWFPFFFPAERSDWVTEDGSLGERGTLLDALPAALERHRPDLMMAAGPDPLLRGVAEAAGYAGIPAYLALETLMACGEGLCLSCVVTLERDGVTRHVRVCHEGPVFLSQEIRW